MATIEPITNPRPKQRFQESGDNITKHRTMVDSGVFQRASDFAILEYAAILSDVPANMTQVSGLKLQGAHEFLQVLRGLAEKETAPLFVPRSGELNHQA